MEIISIEAKDYLGLQISKDIFNLSASDFQKDILKQVDILEKKLNKICLKYKDFKKNSFAD